MKKMFFLIVLMMLFIYSSGGNINNIKQDIKLIRNEFIQINSFTDYKIIEKKIDNLSSESGSLQLFYEREQIKKAIVKIYGEMGMILQEFYFKNRQLIFVYTEDTDYSNHIMSGDIERTTSECRYYFKNNNLISCVKRDQNVLPENIEPLQIKKLLKIGSDIINYDMEIPYLKIKQGGISLSRSFPFYYDNLIIDVISPGSPYELLVQNQSLDTLHHLKSKTPKSCSFSIPINKVTVDSVHVKILNYFPHGNNHGYAKIGFE